MLVEPTVDPTDPLVEAAVHGASVPVLVGRVPVGTAVLSCVDGVVTAEVVFSATPAGIAAAEAVSRATPTLGIAAERGATRPRRGRAPIAALSRFSVSHLNYYVR
jgi:hypothetical protein